MEEIEFFDVKTKAKFKATQYEVREKSGRNFVVTKSPTGTHECWKVISKDKAAALKNG